MQQSYFYGSGYVKSDGNEEWFEEGNRGLFQKHYTASYESTQIYTM
jgi:hypothetical protein